MWFSGNSNSNLYLFEKFLPIISIKITFKIYSFHQFDAYWSLGFKIFFMIEKRVHKHMQNG